MKVRQYLLGGLFLGATLLSPALAHAQDFGVMESAETINKGNFKLMGYPMFVFGNGDSTTGVAVRAGYGLTDTFDFEGKVALYDGLQVFGGDVEFWVLKGDDKPVDLSIGAGFHLAKSDFADSRGVDLTVIASHAVKPKLDLYAAIDMAFNSFTEGDASFHTLHVVPGIEYKIAANLDFVAELGIALNDEASNYLSAGLAYYLR